jgi:hypothetical protein
MPDSPDASVAVLQSQMSTMSDTVSRIETKLDAFNNNFVTKAEFSEFKQRWFFSHTLAAVAGSVMSGVIVYFLVHK